MQRIGRQHAFYSGYKAWTGDGGRLNWIGSEIVSQTRGPTGGRWVIDELLIEVNNTDFTVATAAILGADMYRFLQRITVIERGAPAPRYDEVSGDGLRIFLFQALGASDAPEYADEGVASNIDTSFRFRVPLAKPFMHGKKDHSLPVDLLDRVQIAGASAASLSEGQAAVTIASLQYRVIAVCHEEHSIDLKAQDSVKEFDFTNTSGVHLPVDGRLNAMSFYKPAGDGGTSMASFTSLTIPTLMPEPVTKEVLKDLYKNATGAASNGPTLGGVKTSDPHALAVPTAIPIFFGRNLKIGSMPEQRDVAVKTTNTISGLKAICHILKPKAAATAVATVRQWRADPTKAYYATENKTRRGANDWPPRLAEFLPQRMKDNGQGG